MTTQFSTRKLSDSLLAAPFFHSGLCKALFRGVKSRGNLSRLPRVSFLWDTQDTPNPPSNKLWQHVMCGCQESPLDTQCPRLWWQAGHVLQFPVPRNQAVFGINHIIHTNSLGSVIHHYHIGNGGNPTKIRVPRPQGQEYLLQYLLSHCFLICDTEKFGIGSGGERARS